MGDDNAIDRLIRVVDSTRAQARAKGGKPKGRRPSVVREGKAIGKEGMGNGENRETPVPSNFPVRKTDPALAHVIAAIHGPPPPPPVPVAPVEITPEGWAKVLQAARDGIAPPKLWAFSGLGRGQFARLLEEQPGRGEEIEGEQIRGEHAILACVTEGAPGWQARAWQLERTRDSYALHRHRQAGQPVAMGSAHLVLAAFSTSEPPAQTVEVQGVAT